MNPTLEALALTWAKAHAAEVGSPEKLCRLFWDAYFKMEKVYEESAKSAKANAKQPQSEP